MSKSLVSPFSFLHKYLPRLKISPWHSNTTETRRRRSENKNLFSRFNFGFFLSHNTQDERECQNNVKTYWGWEYYKQIKSEQKMRKTEHKMLLGTFKISYRKSRSVLASSRFVWQVFPWGCITHPRHVSVSQHVDGENWNFLACSSTQFDSQMCRHTRTSPPRNENWRMKKCFFLIKSLFCCDVVVVAGEVVVRDLVGKLFCHFTLLTRLFFSYSHSPSFPLLIFLRFLLFLSRQSQVNL